jgi:hypothetical protein
MQSAIQNSFPQSLPPEWCENESILGEALGEDNVIRHVASAITRVDRDISLSA